MLDNLAVVIEAEYVDAGVVLISRPLLMAMQHHVITFRHRANEMGNLARVRVAHPLEILNEGLLAVGNMRVVLDVLVTDVSFYGLTRLALIEHQVVEGLRISFVLLGIAHCLSILHEIGGQFTYS